MQLKHYKRQDLISVWPNSKNHSDLLICSVPNIQNPSLSDLQILSLDLTQRNKDLTCLGKASYNQPFRCLAWDTFGESDDTLPHGLLFGGMNNGSFTLWNPSEMIGKNQNITINGIDEQSALIYAEELEEEGSPILCAQWNALKNNYLAFGSTSLLLMDVGKDVSSPDIMKPSQKNPHEGSYITSVTWNKQVPHILASSGSDGLIALWDIKTNKSIFNFKDSAPTTSYRQVEIAWSKHVSTQIAVTLDDERKNQLQIWDLRNKKGPIIVIDREHTKGINSMNWSEIDHDLILTASRDHKVVCWNYKEDEVPIFTKEIDTEVQKVAWSRSLPSIYSVTTTEGLHIYSMDENNILNFVPKWMKTPASCTFSGNDRLLVHSENKGNSLHEYNLKISMNKAIGEEIGILDQFINKGAVKIEDDFWNLINLKNYGDGDINVYDFLGLYKQKIIEEVEKYTGKKRDSGCTINQRKKKSSMKSGKIQYIPFSGNDAEDFFGSLGGDDDQPIKQNNDDEGETQNIKYDMVPCNSNWNIGKERLIKQSMLVGNYEGAIDVALKCGRTAQALIIAYSIDQNTFNSTLKTFFTETTDHFISDILKHIAFRDTDQLVRKYDLQNWRECIGLIFSLSSSEKRKSLLNLLGERLQEHENYEDESVFCFILSQKFDKIVQAYEKKLSSLKNNSSERKAMLVKLGTKLLAIRQSFTITLKPNIVFDKIVREMGLVCLENGKKILAYTIFTKYVPNSTARYIDYLIYNTSQLADYRVQAAIVQLPIMSAKVSQKNSKKTKAVQDIPVNMKNQNKKGPAKPIAIPDIDQSQKKAKIKNTPFNPYEGAQTTSNPNVPPIKKNVPPPPPSIKKEVHQNPPQVISPPPPPKKEVYHEKISAPVVPPPPNRPLPPKNFRNEKQEEEQESHVHRPPPPSQSRKIPPPPPPSQQQSNQKQEQKPQIVRPPPKMQKTNPPPPPPPPSQKKEENIQQNSGYQKGASQRTPPPSKQANKIPPPPISRQPVSHQYSKNEDQDEDQDEDDQYSSNVSNKKMPPPPPPSNIQKKNIPTKPPQVKQPEPPTRHTQRPPPPPTKQQQESYTQPQQQRPPPPPPNRGQVRPPPPPPRR